ncbi:phosphate ABC transporter substrate-binding protein PstS family protein [Halorussus sp. AFM4]|uniref:phosphate ABC transporter substrate-binding protein PstS family protein n=1 Tax=Halorussus sp. AFM4 TaxID=3421651 RepID=UPI003EC0CC5E
MTRQNGEPDQHDVSTTESKTNTSRRQFLTASGAAGATMLTGSAVVGAQDDTLSGKVQIAGSSTVYPITTALAEEFEKQHNNITISVSSTGTGGGFANFFCAGKTDINDASRPIQQKEIEQCRGNDIQPVEFQVATDALTVVVNNEADWVDCVTFAELREIWGPGDPPQKWSDVRSEWPNKELNLYGAASTSGTFDFFTETVMGEEGKHRSDYQGTEKDNTIVQAVQGDQYAMGYFGFAYYISNKDSLKALSITNNESEQTTAQTTTASSTTTSSATEAKCVPPTFQTARSGQYPLARPLFIYVKQSSLSEEAVREFTRFYLEKSDSDLIKQVGYVPVSTKTSKQNLQKLQNITSGM